MTSASWSLSFIAAVSILIACPRPSHSWDSDIELYDLVEEIQQNFYEFLSVEQDASSTDIRKAYRRLSLTLHPDKNKDANAETQFRQLVGIYEVLKDEERRQRYNDVLVNGLPDWRQPVFYYRRVRKMSNGELGFLLFLILTVCHYVVIWSVYLEKQLDELLSKKKKEKKKKTSSKSAEETRFIGQEKIERSHDKPHWQDILPLKLSTWLYLSVKSLPHVIQDAKQYYKDCKEMKIREKEEVEAMALAEQDATTIKEKRSKVKKPKFEFPVYEPSLTVADSANSLAYDQGTSIEEIENQLDDWLVEDKKSQKKKAPEWSEEDITLLTRSMAKFPGGTPGRWEKIAHELGRSVTDVTAKVKQVKDGQTNTSGLVKLSELKAQGSSAFPGKGSIAGAGTVPDSLMTQREDPQPPAAAMTEGTEYRGGADEEEGIQSGGVRRRGKKTGGGRAGVEAKGHRQRDFDYTAAAEKDSGEEQSPPPSSVPQPSKEKATAETDDVWTQNQQKLLELALQQYPRGTTERWDWIAKVVPGKRKEECMIRYKLLAELVLKRKQAKS